MCTPIPDVEDLALNQTDQYPCPSGPQSLVAEDRLQDSLMKQVMLRANGGGWQGGTDGRLEVSGEGAAGGSTAKVALGDTGPRKEK